MSGIDLAFGVLAIVAVVSGWRVFRTDSMVRASFLLLLSFIAVAGIMLLLSAAYIGAATIFMMAVEMMVMALFMVMFMMNPAGLNPMNMVHQQRWAVAAGVIAFAGLAGAVLVSPLPDMPVSPARAVTHDLGLELLGDSMLVFESAGVALLAAMIGSVILSSRSGRFGAADEASRPPALHPGGEPAGQRPEKKKPSHGHASHHGQEHHAHDGERGDGADRDDHGGGAAESEPGHQSAHGGSP